MTIRAVRSASYESGYRLLLTFEDGTVESVDLGEHLDGEIFQPLKDQSFSKKVRVDPEMETIVWPNGADFAPEFLFEIGEDVADSQARTTS